MGAEGSFEVFTPGEMEKEYEARAGSGDLSLWKALEKGYTKVVDQLIQPPRKQYTLGSLGPSTFSFVVDSMPQTTLTPVSPRHHATREDFVVVTPTHSLHGSFWSVASSRGFSHPSRRPCVLFLHSNMGTRVDALAIRDHVLAAGFSLASFDFGGSGHSTGTYITGGVREAVDVGYVLEFLKANYDLHRFFLWGHSLGAAAALLYMQQLNLSTRPVALPPAATIPTGAELVTTRTSPTTTTTLPSCSTSTHVATTSHEPQPLVILAAVLDSPYTTFQDMTESIVETVKSNGLPAPAALLRLGMRMVTKSIESRGGFVVAQVRAWMSMRTGYNDCFR
ncbi:hypothetical protein, variant [Aphanomyces astaci]|uniref:Serine aminopeptidase S33 domain-containing protein n=1 Tax=Aphanomyces astaci TaxID=112090 RepID=W4G1Q6_APHAT|nr:hypothetical protein, variant [Aphanomyces astaci]ETV73206.1 hypothetical protein, variant [Aphanomyces astaci]|eukprot:XP_009837410.1 hypothetical protein, variant [Aphanomyces astaci]